MLPAHDELTQYAACAGTKLAPGQQAVIARSIKGMTTEEADAWMALLTAAEEQGKADEDTETCGFCGASLPEPAAVLAGWVPYYFIGEQEVDSATCCECAAAHLIPLDDGEWELSPPADQPIIIN